MEKDIKIRNLTKELEGLGFSNEQSDKIIEWVDTIPIMVFYGKDIHVEVKKGGVMINSNLINPNKLSFNLLDEQTRLNFLYHSGNYYNPFKLPKDIILVNPFTGIAMKSDGTPADLGNTIHYMHNVFNHKLFTKIEYKDGYPIKTWVVNEQNEWEERELRKE